MDFERFSKKYRQFIEERKVELPDDLWSTLSSELDSDMADNAKTNVINSKQKSNDINEVWNIINFELDIDDVWNNIDSELSKKKKKKFVTWWVSMPAAACILILFLLWPTFKNTHHESTISDNAIQVIIDTTQHNKQYTLNTNNVNKTNDYIAVKTTNKRTEEVQVTKFHSQVITKPKNASNNIEINRLQKITDSITYSNHELKLIAQHSPKQPSIEKESKKFNLSNWSLGINISAKNTWLANQKTVNGLQSSNMSTSNVKVVPDFGFFLTYHSHARWSITGSFYHRSRVDQSYSEYIYGNYSNHQYQLSYSTFELLYKYNNKRNLMIGKKLKRRSVAGIYYAHLSSAIESVSNKSSEILSSFNNDDYGIILGQDWQFMHKRLMLNIGTYIKYGIPSISNSSEHISGFKDTHNLSFEIRLGFELGLKK